MMTLFARLVSNFQPPMIFGKSSVLDVSMGHKYAPNWGSVLAKQKQKQKTQENSPFKHYFVKINSSAG